MDTLVKEKNDAILVSRKELKEIVAESMYEVLEDIALMRAIDEGMKTDDIPVDEFLQREKERIRELEVAE